MTQEQLAETMGVSISAVHKWESGQSTPDIRLILEMADLFHTSTDVLLGYEWRNHNVASALERMETLMKKQSTMRRLRNRKKH
ncbi:MAG: helix-turn-helix transcriptional regulator [Clostridia bacterium]|nr:helix-turn-helix transcriptional regulator [Clostridia bacterium]